MKLPTPRRVLRSLFHSRLNHRCRAYDAAALTRSAIVFAPHQDDETLGCGGTIVRKKAVGAEVRIVFMTDGAGSHAHLMSAAELKALRVEEALAAAEVLGLTRDEVLFLAQPDGGLAQKIDAATPAVVELLQAHRPEEVFIPYHKESPPDHWATNVIVRRALREAGLAADVYEYPIWYWRHWPQVSLAGSWRQRLSVVKSSWRARLGWGLLTEFQTACEVGDVIDRKRQALARHRSQMERLRPETAWPTLGDVSNGEFLACFFQDREVFFRR